MKEKIKNNKRKILLLSIFTMILVLSGVSYAFFSASVVENNKTETVIKTNKLTLIYTGGTEINCSNIIPGDSCTKTFSVENTSNTPVDYNIYMESITNEFNEDLVYTLTDDNGEVISETVLPETNENKSYLKTSINIDNGQTKNYTLKIEYKYDANKLQNDNQGKIFKGTVGIDTEQNISIATGPLCKRALSLHTTTSNGTEITFGNLNSGEEINVGDAFDCDVNGDGNYNPETERFYYLRKKDDKLVLVYSKNYSTGIFSNEPSANSGPLEAIKKLPTSKEWNYVKNVNLTSDIKDSSGKVLTSNYEYTELPARLISYDDIHIATNVELGTMKNSELDEFKFLFEDGNAYGGKVNPMTEIAFDRTTTLIMQLYSGSNLAAPTSLKDELGIKPVIEVDLDDMKLSIEYIDYESADNKNAYNDKKGQQICKRAMTLHTEECNNTYSGCDYHGLYGKTITYGSLGEKGVLSSGDAYDCDVNGDDEYNPETERFYYVSDYYNTFTNTYESDKAVLIQSKIGATDFYHSEYKNWYGPTVAYKHLPDVSEWKNVTLFHKYRQILNEKNGTKTDNLKFDAPHEIHDLKVFDYGNKAARFLTAQEVNKACEITVGNRVNGELNKCIYLLEDTQYTYSQIQRKQEIMLETVVSDNMNYIWELDMARDVFDVPANSGTIPGYSMKFTIELPKTNMEI